MSEQYLLNDAEVARFLVTGYHLVEPELPVGLNENIADQLDALVVPKPYRNWFNAI